MRVSTPTVAMALACVVLTVSEATALDFVSAFADVTVELDGLFFADEDVAVDNLLGITVPSPLEALERQGV